MNKLIFLFALLTINFCVGQDCLDIMRANAAKEGLKGYEVIFDYDDKDHIVACNIIYHYRKDTLVFISPKSPLTYPVPKPTLIKLHNTTPDPNNGFGKSILFRDDVINMVIMFNNVCNHFGIKIEDIIKEKSK